ncbi:MAG: polysaccharide deacetylase family protein, partial [Candidatus Thioglobus sp.]|nr:polysaccharide deacetylase family protein [Candidatus Thioglobus sp.]
HSLSHPHLLDLDSGQVLDEIKNAQKRLRKHLKVTAKILAYPYGEANLAIMQSVKNLDYTAFGQHSGVVSASSNWQNLPRFPMAANYAKMPKFREKVNALPMPLVARKINPIFTQNPPTLKLEFPQALSKQQKSQFMCFVKGGVNMVWSGNKSVKITAKKRLKKRRSKYNCTFPSGQKGRFYWHSVQWINPKIAE